jgi:hypothetical protein
MKVKNIVKPRKSLGIIDIYYNIPVSVIYPVHQSCVFRIQCCTCDVIKVEINGSGGN